MGPLGAAGSGRPRPHPHSHLPWGPCFFLLHSLCVRSRCCCIFFWTGNYNCVCLRVPDEFPFRAGMAQHAHHFPQLQPVILATRVTAALAFRQPLAFELRICISLLDAVALHGAWLGVRSVGPETGGGRPWRMAARPFPSARDGPGGWARKMRAGTRKVGRGVIIMYHLMFSCGKIFSGS